MMMKIQRYIRDHEKVMYFLSLIYRSVMFNRIKGHKGLKIIGGGAFLRKLLLKIMEITMLLNSVKAVESPIARFNCLEITTL